MPNSRSGAAAEVREYSLTVVGARSPVPNISGQRPPVFEERRAQAAVRATNPETAGTSVSIFAVAELRIFGPVRLRFVHDRDEFDSV